MSSLRRALLAVVLTGITAACTLIDPLDDVTGGPPKSDPGKKSGTSASSSSGGNSSSGTSGSVDHDASSSSSSGANASSSGTTSSGSPGSCGGKVEIEPNDVTPTPLANNSVNCGVLTKGVEDTDRWSFVNTTGGTLSIVATIDASAPVDYVMQSGGDTSSGEGTGTVFGNLAAGATLTLTIDAAEATTALVAYRITFTAN